LSKHDEKRCERAGEPPHTGLWKAFPSNYPYLSLTGNTKHSDDINNARDTNNTRDTGGTDITDRRLS
jgi:hypothetical protein